MAIPGEFQGQKYVSLVTFRKNGVPVYTPLWFAEQDGKLYVQTRNDSGKYKRIRNNPPGALMASTFSIPRSLFRTSVASASPSTSSQMITNSRLPIWSKKNEYLEIDFSG